MKRRQTRFTLIELLVVIAIIAVLAGILLPTISIAVRKAHIAKAKAEMTSLMAAISLYQSEYDAMPFKYNDVNTTETSRILSDSDYDTLISFLSQTGNDDDKNKGNVRKLKILSVKKAATYLDPWDKRYHIVYDCKYNDEILVNDIVGLRDTDATIPCSVVIWSEGPDETVHATPNNKANKDNVYTIDTNWDSANGHVIP